MSREEQLAFIDRFGARLESLLERQRVEIREQQRAIDDKLRRIEFLHESTRPIRGATLFVDLNRPYTPEELGHFRVLLEVLSLPDPDPHPTLWLAVRDGYVAATYHDASVLLYGETSIVWSRNPDEMLQQTNVATHRGVQSGRIEGGAYLYNRGPFHSLAEFDRTTVSVFVTKPLFDKIAYVGLIVNDYLLVGAPRDQIITPRDLEETGRGPFATWPVSLSEQEQRVEWVELYIKGPDAHIKPDLEHPPFLLRRAIPWGIDYRTFTPINVLVGEQETDDSGS
jgi:hypothetical protein